MFNPESFEDMIICWDYRNLQWLTKEQNIAKFNHIKPEYLTEWHYELLDKMGISI